MDAEPTTKHQPEPTQTMQTPANTKRRSVLRGIGAGLVGGTVLTGSASARGNGYANGNAIGAFLNEEALYKESPVWDTGVADKTGQDEVDVLWSGLTEVINPETGEIVPGPWGVDPRAVKVSPGTDVTWTWYDGPGAIDVHHLVSFFDPPYQDPFPDPFAEEGNHEHEHPGGDGEFFAHEDLGESFTHTFDEIGTYLYFCIPHGIPNGVEIEGAPPDLQNLFGQRGVVKVVDD
jgi:plastocyanin